MAKKTKDSNLSIEERLEQALIPNWDEPYKLPPNWCWVKLSTVCSLENGEKSTEKDLVYLDAKTLRGITEPKTRDSGIVVNKDQKVILVDGENSGEVFVVPYRGYMGSTFKIINIAANADEMYIRYFIDQNRERLRNSKVGSAIPHLNKDLFFDLKLPFPPLCEQKRIVSHIETLFAKLDEASEKAQEVVDGFETRKAAILHKAFSGELTAKWREENGVSLDGWEHLTLDDVADYKKGPFGSSITKAMFVPKGENTYKVYEQGNAIRKTLDYGSYYISQKKYEELKGFAIKPGDIIVSCAGTIGEIYKLPNNCEAGVINQALMRVRVYSNINEMYFIHYFTGVLKGDVIDEANGTAIKNIPPFKVLKAMNILLPSLFEQNKIVEILERMLSKEQYAKEIAEAVIDQIDTMKKAILACAFRGELGTNDPSEESAIELIKQIIEEKIKTEESKSKRTSTKRKEVSFVAKTILEALKSSEKLTPEKLKAETVLEIDDFYDQLKVLIDNGQIREIRIDGESYLEAVK